MIPYALPIALTVRNNAPIDVDPSHDPSSNSLGGLTWNSIDDAPSHERMATGCRDGGFVERQRIDAAPELRSYDDLYQYSIANPADYWKEILDFCGVAWRRPYAQFLDPSSRAEFPKWFVGGQLNWVDSVLRWSSLPETADQVAVVAEREDGSVASVTYSELADRVSRLRNRAERTWCSARRPYRPADRKRHRSHRLVVGHCLLRRHRRAAVQRLRRRRDRRPGSRRARARALIATRVSAGGADGSTRAD